MMLKGQLHRLLLVSVKGLGPSSVNQLISVFGSAREAINAGPEICAECINRPQLKPVLSHHWPGEGDTVRFEGRLKASGVTVIERGMSHYPRQLADVDGPRFLFVKGDFNILSYPLAAVVGTRSVRPDGIRLTHQVAAWCIGRGWTVVSGGAIGVDSAAHLESLRQHKPTVVILPAGLDHLVPRGHLKLFSQVIEKGGCLVSEYLPWTRPFRGGFLKRNRIISGISEYVVVVRAPLCSGALSTARWGKRQGRPVYIVPGEPNDTTVTGCLHLLTQGAYPLYSISCLPISRRGEAGDVEAESTEVAWDIPMVQSEDAKEILHLLIEGPLDVASLVNRLGRSVQSVTTHLMMLMLVNKVLFSPREGLYRAC
jgi:DNA processing protein